MRRSRVLKVTGKRGRAIHQSEGDQHGMKFLRWARRGLPVILVGLLGLNLLIGTAGAATPQVKVESKSVELVFDGQKLAIPQGQYVFMVNGTNYVPIRFISYALQKNVGWDAKTQTVTVTEPSTVELAMLKEYLLNAHADDGQLSSKGGAKLSVKPIQAKFVFDGENKSLPNGQSGYILNNSIYVPIRFMSESVRTEIKWDGKSGKISAESPAYQQEQQTNSEVGKQDAGASVGDTPAVGADKGTTNGVGGGVGGAGGGAPASPTYESITANAEQRLHELENNCKQSLYQIALSALGATGDEKAQLKSQGQTVISQCTTQFNQIVNDTQKMLTDNHFSTDIIKQYKDYFDQQLKTGRDALDTLMK